MQVGEVERYWTGGRIKVFHGTLCINLSLFYVVQVRYRYAYMSNKMEGQNLFFILLIDSL